MRKHGTRFVACSHSVAAISVKRQGACFGLSLSLFLRPAFHFLVYEVQYLFMVHIVGAFDPELRSVLELATDSELYELERILFGPRLKTFLASVCL